MRNLVLGTRCAGVLAAVLLATCGGSDSGGGTEQTVTLAALPAWCGSMTSSDQWDQGDLSSGDEASGTGRRAILVFDLSPLGGAVTVTLAVLNVHECSGLNTPYLDLGGSLLVDHFDPGVAIDPDDYDGGGLTTPIGSISTTGEFTCTPRAMEVTAQVQDDVTQGRTRSAFRFHFTDETDGDTEADLTSLAAMHTGTPDPQPELVVTFRR